MVCKRFRVNVEDWCMQWVVYSASRMPFWSQANCVRATKAKFYRRLNALSTRQFILIRLISGAEYSNRIKSVKIIISPSPINEYSHAKRERERERQRERDAPASWIVTAVVGSFCACSESPARDVLRRASPKTVSISPQDLTCYNAITIIISVIVTGAGLTCVQLVSRTRITTFWKVVCYTAR